MPKIIIDRREGKEIIEELIKQGIEPEVKQLDVADFIIQTKNFNGKHQIMGVERKNQNDFLNSIIDKRLIKQLNYLKENFDAPLLIIEGSEDIYELRNFHPNSIHGMLASIAIDYQVPILHTKNYKETAALLAVIAKRLERPKRLISLLTKRKPLTIKEQQELIIQSLPFIGPKLAKSLLKKFKSVKKIINLSEEELQKINGIGPKKVEKIKKVINTLYQL